MSLYRCEETSRGEYRVRKYDEDFNLQADYRIRGSNCSCPAWRQNCKHLDMVRDLKAGKWPAAPNEFYNERTKQVTRIG